MDLETVDRVQIIQKEWKKSILTDICGNLEKCIDELMCKAETRHTKENKHMTPGWGRGKWKWTGRSGLI